MRTYNILEKDLRFKLELYKRTHSFKKSLFITINFKPPIKRLKKLKFENLENK